MELQAEVLRLKRTHRDYVKSASTTIRRLRRRVTALIRRNENPQ
jgi:hypothetical protein